MVLIAAMRVLAVSAAAAFRVALPAPVLPSVSIGVTGAAGMAAPVAPLTAGALATPRLPQAAVLPAQNAVFAAPSLSGAPAVSRPTGRTEAAGRAAKAALPALSGKAAWTNLFDGTGRTAANGVTDARRPGLHESWDESYRLYTDVRSLHDELSAIHIAERAGDGDLAGRKRGLRARLKSADERLNGPLDADFPLASARLRAARASRDSARTALYAAMRSETGRAAVAEASSEVRRAEAEAVGAGLRTARLLLEGAARVHSKEGRRNAAIKTLSAASAAALALHTEVAYGGARTLRLEASGPVEVPVRRWRNADAGLKAPAAKVAVLETTVYPDVDTAVRAQQHQLQSMDAEVEHLARRSSEVSFWVELLASPLAPAENAAFATFIEDSLSWASRGAVPAKREAAQRISEAAKAAAEGSFDVAASRLEAARNALDARADELERMRRAVERRKDRLSAGPEAHSAAGRHEALLEAAARWRRLLRRPLDAARAADLAGEARNHREAYLSGEEPGLPGYRRAAKDLERLEAALTSLKAAEARSLIDRFEENLIHRRSLKVSIILRQDKAGGTTREAVRFALPGTTLRTMLRRIGGIPEKPEVRVNGGTWTPYGSLDLRGKLADETLLEILLPPAGR